MMTISYVSQSLSELRPWTHCAVIMSMASQWISYLSSAQAAPNPPSLPHTTFKVIITKGNFRGCLFPA